MPSRLTLRRQLKECWPFRSKRRCSEGVAAACKQNPEDAANRTSHAPESPKIIEPTNEPPQQSKQTSTVLLSGLGQRRANLHPSDFPSGQRALTTPGSRRNWSAFDKAWINLDEDTRRAFQIDPEKNDPEIILAKMKNAIEEHQSTSSTAMAEGLSVFKQFLDAFWFLTTADTTQVSPLVVGGVSWITDVFVSYYEFFDTLSSLISRFSDYLAILPLYSAVKFEGGALVSVYADLLEFCAKVREIFLNEQGEQKKWAKLDILGHSVWNPYDKQFEVIESNFKYHLELLKDTVQATQWQREAEENKRIERTRFLNWISQIDYEETHEKLRQKKHHGTANWLTDSAEFKRWFHEAESSMLWCKGGPGRGKTLLASHVIDFIADHESKANDRVGTAFSYCHFKASMGFKPSAILASLYKQLCRKVRDLPEDLIQFYRELYDNGNPVTLGKLKTILETVFECFDKTYIVIDGIDEWPSDVQDGDQRHDGLMGPRKELLDLVLEIYNTAPMVKILITSRPEADIENRLSCKHGRDSMSPNGHKCIATIDIEESTVRNDIKCVIESTVNEEPFSIMDDELKAEVISILAEKSNGLFLWVRLQLQSLRSFFENHSAEETESHRIDSRKVREKLESMPSGLNGTYCGMLEAILREDEDRKRLALRALSWVVFAKRPLDMLELRHGVATQGNPVNSDLLGQHSLRKILRVCHGFLETERVGDDKPKVFLIHFSAQEFLSNVETIQATKAHMYIAKSCLSYLCAQDFHEEAKTLLPRELKTKWALASYAAGFFDFHIFEATHKSETLDPEILSLVRRLCTSYTESFNVILHLRQNANQAVMYPFYFGSTLADHMLWRVPRHPVNGSTILYGSSLCEIPSIAEDAQISAIDIVTGTLYAAADSRNLAAVRILLETAPQKDCFQIFLEQAMFRGCDELINLLLDRRPAEASGFKGRGLVRACIECSAQTVKRLLDCGVDPNVENNGTPLMGALVRGDLETTVALLEHGAHVDKRGLDLESAMIYHDDQKCASFAELFLEHSRKSNRGTSFTSALVKAARLGHVQTVATFLRSGVDVGSTNGNKRTALHLAAAEWEADVVSLLLDHGADPNLQCFKYGTPLHAALASRAYINSAHAAKLLATVTALLDHGATASGLHGEYGGLVQAAVAPLRHDDDADDAQDPAQSDALFHLLDLLIRSGADPNAVGGRYATALQAALAPTNKRRASHLPVRTARFLLDRGAGPNLCGGHFGTPLQAALAPRRKSHRRYLDAARLLLERGADVNAQGGKYGTPLQAAARGRGALEKVTLLLEHGGTSGVGVDVNAVAGKYGTALQAAAACSRRNLLEQLMVVQKLVNAGADVNLPGGKYGGVLLAALVKGGGHGEKSALPALVRFLLDECGADARAAAAVGAGVGRYGGAVQAAMARRKSDVPVEVLELLLARGADVNARGELYGTALQAGVANGKPATHLEWLLQNGADVDATGGLYGSALHAATARPPAEAKAVVSLLLAHGADTNVVTDRDGTPLYAAVLRGALEVVDMLLKHGADVSLTGGTYGTALQAGATTDHVELVRKLLQHGATVNKQGGFYGTALIAAARMGPAEAVQVLLEHGANPSITDDEGATALHYSASRGSVDAVRALLEKGADVNAFSRSKGSVLTAAVAESACTVEVVQLLLDHGADVNRTHEGWDAPLQIARRPSGSLDVEELLLANGANP